MVMHCTVPELQKLGLYIESSWRGRAAYHSARPINLCGDDDFFALHRIK